MVHAEKLRLALPGETWDANWTKFESVVPEDTNEAATSRQQPLRQVKLAFPGDMFPTSMEVDPDPVDMDTGPTHPCPTSILYDAGDTFVPNLSCARNDGQEVGESEPHVQCSDTMQTLVDTPTETAVNDPQSTWGW